MLYRYRVVPLERVGLHIEESTNVNQTKGDNHPAAACCQHRMSKIGENVFDWRTKKKKLLPRKYYRRFIRLKIPIILFSSIHLKTHLNTKSNIIYFLVESEGMKIKM